MDTFLFILILCFFTVSMPGRTYTVSAKDTNLLRIAIFMTVAADFCMLVIYNNLLGLCFFICVQTLHHYRYCGLRRTAVQILCCFTGILTASAIDSGIQNSLASGYFISIIFSVSGAASAYKKYPSPNNRFILTGMILFLLCDINVGIYNLAPLSKYSRLFWSLIWVFYIPSQILLAVSGKNIREKTYVKK